MNEFDLMMKSILDEATEEVPAGVWEGVSDGLDKINAAKRKRAVIWFARAAAATAAAAAIALAVVFNHSGSDAIVPPTDADGLIAVVEPENIHTDIFTPSSESTSEASIVHNTPAGNLIAHAGSQAAHTLGQATSSEGQATNTSGQATSSEDQATHTTEQVIPSSAGEFIEDISSDVSSAKSREPQVYFPEDWGEDDTKGNRPETSIILSGLAGTNSAQTRNRIGPQKAPVVTPAPEKTSVTETSTKSTYGIPVSFGAGVKIGLSPRWSLGIGANYTKLTREFYGKYTKIDSQGAVENSTSSDIHNIQHYVGIPVNAYFNIISQDRVSLYAYAGGTIEKCLADNYVVLNTSIVHKEKVKGLQMSTDIGIGVEFALSHHLGIYIDPSVRYYFDNGQPNSIRTAQPLMFGFEMGLRVNL